MTWPTDPIFHLAGYTLAAPGLLIAVWSLFLRGPRISRRTPHCPRCWYDMSGSVSASPAENGGAGVPPASSSSSSGGAGFQPVSSLSTLSRAAGEGRVKASTPPVPSQPLQTPRSQPSLSLTCPECGHNARSHRRLFKRRRHWRLATLGLILLIAAYGVWTTPRIRRTGWPGAVPTTALLVALPWLDPVEHTPPFWRDHGWSAKGIHARLANELTKQRIPAGQLWPWQLDLLARRCLAGDGGRAAYSKPWQEFYEPILRALERSNALSAALDQHLDDVGAIQLSCRSSWPAGVPLYARLDRYRFRDYNDTRWSLDPVTTGLKPQAGFHADSGLGLQCCVINSDDPWNDSEVLLGVVPDPTSHLEFRQSFERGHAPSNRWTMIGSPILRVPTRIISTPGLSPAEVARGIVKPVPSEAIAGALRQRTIAYLYAQTGTGADVVIEPENTATELLNAGLTLALRLELLRDSAPFARGEAWWSPRGGLGTGYMYPMDGNRVHLDAISPVEEAAPPPRTKHKWSLRLTGDPIVALRDFDATAYWDGEVTLTIGSLPEYEQR